MAQPTGTAKLHSLIFGMLYPAFYGAFLLTQLTRAGPPDFPPWGALLTVYFAAQFVEGLEAKNRFTIPRALATLFEILLMVLIFAALGYFPDLRLPEGWRTPAATAIMMFAAFILPAAHRLIFALDSLQKGKSGYMFARALTGMSILAALLSLWIYCWAAWTFVLLLLLGYMLFFQFANEWLVSQLKQKWGWSEELRRP